MNRELFSVSFVNMIDKHELRISNLVNGIRIGVIKITREYYNLTYFKNFYDHNISLKKLQKLKKLFNSEDKENRKLGCRLIFKLLNLNQDEFIQESLSRLKR